MLYYIYMINSLVFSGGGIKIVYYLGLLKLLEEYNIINSINEFIGCSSGAIFSLLLSINFNYDELLLLFNNIFFTNFLNNYDIINIIENYGISDTNNIINIITIIIKNKLKLDNLDNFTFRDHYKLTKNKLIINGSNLTDNKCEIFSNEITPNMLIIDAIKISINIPFLFKNIEYNNKIYCDGGVFSNYPIKYCNNLSNTLGIYLDFNIINIINFNNYLLSIFNIILNKEIDNLDDKFKKNTIFIKSNINFYEFNIPKEELNQCINDGYNISKKFIQEHSDFKKLINES